MDPRRNKPDGDTMGLKDRKQIKVKQKVKRKKKRLKLASRGLDPDKYYHGKFFVGNKEDAGD